MIQKKICRWNENRHFIFKNFFSENSSVYEIMWNMVGPERPQKIKWRMRFPSWITETTHTLCLLLVYIILIAFPQEHWFRERAWMLRYKYLDSLVNNMLSATFISGVTEEICQLKSHTNMKLLRKHITFEIFSWYLKLLQKLNTMQSTRFLPVLQAHTNIRRWMLTSWTFGMWRHVIWYAGAKVSEETTYQTTRRYIPEDRDHTSFLLLLWTTSNMLADFAKNEVAIWLVWMSCFVYFLRSRTS